MKVKEESLEFDSGSEVYSRDGIVAIDRHGVVFRVESWDAKLTPLFLNRATRMELAEAMILKWALYYSEAKNEKGTS